MQVCVDNPPETYILGERHETRCWLHHPDNKTQIDGINKAVGPGA